MPHVNKTLILTLAAGIALGGVAGADDMGGASLAAKTYDPLTGEVSAVLENQSEKTLTAWRVSVVAMSGSEAKNVHLDFDYHIRLYNSRTRARGNDEGILPPGASRRLHLSVIREGMPVLPPPVVSLKLVAAVFADATAYGDQRAIQEIASARGASYGEVTLTLQAVRELAHNPAYSRQTPDSLETYSWALEATQELKGPLPRGGISASVASVIRKDLRDRLNSVSRAIRDQPGKAGSLLQNLLANLEAERAFRGKHANLQPISAFPQGNVAPTTPEDSQ